MNSQASYYEELGVAKQCSVEELKRGYRQSLLQVHPDKQGCHAVGEEAAIRISRIQEAYRVLKDASLRQAYDEGRKAAGLFEQAAQADCDVLLSDMDCQVDAQRLLVYCAPCRCGDLYSLSHEDIKDDLRNARRVEVMVACPSCSLAACIQLDIE